MPELTHTRGASTARWRRPALRYAVRWLLVPLLTVLAASAVIFFLLQVSPGDPVSQILGSRASDEQREALRAHLGLDQSVLTQFWLWLTHAVQGDLGTSFTYRTDVGAIIAPRLGTTAVLVTMAMILILMFGLALGLLGGVAKRARPWVATVLALLISVPSFVAASALTGIFAVNLRWFPTYGAGEPGLDRIWHLTLPAIALAITWTAYVGQLSMASIAEEREKEHVATAIGRGLPFRTVLRRHVLRNAAIPVVTASGLTLASLVAGSIVVETAFAVDGIGSLLVTSVLSKDQPMVAAVSVIVVVAFVALMTLVDVLQVVLDPSARGQEGRS